VQQQAEEHQPEKTDAEDDEAPEERRTNFRRQLDRQAYELNQKLISNAISKDASYSTLSEDVRKTLEGANDDEQEHVILQLLEHLRQQELMKNDMRVRLRQFELSGTNVSKNMIFSTRISELTSKLQARNEKIEGLQHKVIMLETENEKNKSDAAQVNTAADRDNQPSHQSQLALLMGNLKTKHARVQELEALLATRQQAESDQSGVASSSEQLARVSEDLDAAKLKLKAQVREISAFKDSEQILINENNRLRSIGTDIEELEQSLSNERKESQALRDSLEQLMEVSKTVDETNSMLEETKANLDRSRDKISGLEHRLNQEHDHINQLQSKLNSTSDEYASLEAEHQQLKEKLSSLRAENQDLHFRAVNQEELEQATDRARELGVELGRTNASIFLLEQRLSQIESENGELREKLKSSVELQRRLDNLTVKENEYHKQISLLDRSVHEGRSAQQDLNENLKQKNLEIQTLKQDIKSLNARLAATPKTSTTTNGQTGAQESNKNVPKKVVPLKGSKLNRKNTKDDLTRIYGIGPKLEKILVSNGYTQFEDIANLSNTEIKNLNEKLGSFRGRIERDNWKASAKQLLNEKKSKAA